MAISDAGFSRAGNPDPARLAQKPENHAFQPPGSEQGDTQSSTFTIQQGRVLVCSEWDSSSHCAFRGKECVAGAGMVDCRCGERGA